MSYVLTVLLAGEIYRESFHGCESELDARITGAALLMDERIGNLGVAGLENPRREE